MYAVILAGGGGMRLRPLSRPDLPKPFLPLLGTDSLIRQTVDRITAEDGEPLLSHNDIYVVADERYVDLVRHQTGLPRENMLGEPHGRNTGPAVALATIAIDQPADEVMVVLPADHDIRDAVTFRGVLRGAAEVAASPDPDTGLLPLVILGIRPTGPETGYGYIVPAREAVVRHGLAVHPVRKFHQVQQFVEKPDRERAAELLDQQGGGTAWNAGIFVWRRDAIRRALEAHAPQLLADVEAAWDPQTRRLDEERYAAVEGIAIDRAVLERAASTDAKDRSVVLMAGMDVGWSDLGSWTALLEALGAGGVEARVVEAGQRAVTSPDDLLVRGYPLIATVAGGGSMTAYEPTAVLRGAARFKPVVDELIRRCS